MLREFTFMDSLVRIIRVFDGTEEDARLIAAKELGIPYSELLLLRKQEGKQIQRKAEAIMKWKLVERLLCD